MVHHILVPLDGSALAECVLPHVVSIVDATGAEVTLLHVVESPLTPRDDEAVDPIQWHLKKRESESYLDQVANRLKEIGIDAQQHVLEGSPAESIIGYATEIDADLIALSTHGRSGLTGWNVSSVVQKILLRSYRSSLLIRAYNAPQKELARISYQRLFVALDRSTRAEYVLPLATSLAQRQKAALILATVVRKPEMPHRVPLSEEELDMVSRMIARATHEASAYFENLDKQLAPQGIDIQTRQTVSDNVTASLMEMIAQENVDLVLLVAHGYSGLPKWPYGSVANHLISFGTSHLLIMQDMSSEEAERSQAEIAASEIKGH